jgi:hypothetical protein
MLLISFHRRRQGEDAELNEPPVYSLVSCYPESLRLSFEHCCSTTRHPYFLSSYFAFFKKKILGVGILHSGSVHAKVVFKCQ